jgi:hypothetical protein
MTIRETLSNLLRLPSDARAVVEMARENAERCRDNDAALGKVLAQRDEWRDRAKRADARVGEISDRNNDLLNELGPAKALIDVQRHQLHVCTARIQELETAQPKPVTLADLWEPLDHEKWARMSECKNVALLTEDNQVFAGARGDFNNWMPLHFTHVLVLEPPR